MTTNPIAQPVPAPAPTRNNRKPRPSGTKPVVQRLPGTVIVFAGPRAQAVAALIRMLDRMA